MLEDLPKSKIRGFKDLKFWQVSMRLVRFCYESNPPNQSEFHRSFCSLVRTNSGRYFMGTEP